MTSHQLYDVTAHTQHPLAMHCPPPPSSHRAGAGAVLWGGGVPSRVRAVPLVRRGQRVPEVGSTPEVAALGGYRLPPTATHSDSARPAARPPNTPCGRERSRGGGVRVAPGPPLLLPGPPPRYRAPTHGRAARRHEHAQDEGPQQRATDHPHDGEGALGGGHGDGARGGPTALEGSPAASGAWRVRVWPGRAGGMGGRGLGKGGVSARQDLTPPWPRSPAARRRPAARPALPP